MKLLIISQYYFPEQFRVNDVCETLVKLGHDITVLTGLPNYPEGVIYPGYNSKAKRKEFVNGVKVVRCWLTSRSTGNLRLALNYLTFMISSSIKVIFMREKFDAVLVYQLSPITMCMPGIIYKRLNKRKLIIYCNDLWPASIVSGGMKDSGIFYEIIRFFSTWIYKKADTILLSSYGFSHYFKSIHGIENNLVYLPSYAEDIFTNMQLGKKQRTENFNLVFAGNIGELQSIDTIISTAIQLKKIPEIKFHIIGSGSKLDYCKALVVRSGLDDTVKFYGKRPLEEMPLYYYCADAMLIALKRDCSISFTLPNKVQSYLAASKPIMGAADGEVRRIIKESGAGECVESEDVHGFVEIITKYYTNRHLYEKYASNAKEYYGTHFSKEDFFIKLISCL